MDLPRELRYSTGDCWVLVVGESGRIGLCPRWFDDDVKDVVVSLPLLGVGIRSGDVLAEITVDGVRRPIHSPISGSVVLVNERLADDPRPIVADPFGAGWICEMQLSYDETLEQVMDADSYAQLRG